MGKNKTKPEETPPPAVATEPVASVPEGAGAEPPQGAVQDPVSPPAADPQPGPAAPEPPPAPASPSAKAWPSPAYRVLTPIKLVPGEDPLEPGSTHAAAAFGNSLEELLACRALEPARAEA